MLICSISLQRKHEMQASHIALWKLNVLRHGDDYDDDDDDDDDDHDGDDDGGCGGGDNGENDIDIETVNDQYINFAKKSDKLVMMH